MRRIGEIEDHELSPVRVLLSDVDDTISTEGKLLPEAYAALWDLKRAGIAVVVVTGRPAGWCDLMARFWPVDAVVGENGGFYFLHDGTRMQRVYRHDAATRAGFRKRLEGVRERILEAVPGCAVAADQPYREYDLAIDFREDVPPLSRDAVVRIRDLFHEAGAHAKISSIHVNGWYGDFDKLATSLDCLRDVLGVDGVNDREACVFCGDSPNDEPMFAHFPLSFGMANLKPYLDLIEKRPGFIADAPGGAGFTQVAERLLAAKGMKIEDSAKGDAS